MMLETKPFDVAEFLTDDETIAAYLTEVLENDGFVTSPGPSARLPAPAAA